MKSLFCIEICFGKNLSLRDNFENFRVLKFNCVVLIYYLETTLNRIGNHIKLCEKPQGEVNHNREVHGLFTFTLGNV